jgi:hypothetical protein
METEAKGWSVPMCSQEEPWELARGREPAVPQAWAQGRAQDLRLPKGGQHGDLPHMDLPASALTMICSALVSRPSSSGPSFLK